ncbi:MAG: hypothetical protein ACOYOL_12475 [Chthoniobacterales bacterium]
MSYFVHYRLSATAARVYCVPRRNALSKGPFEKLKYAKKIAAELRKDRCTTIWEGPNREWESLPGGGWRTVDHGPTYSDVKIIKVQLR